MRAYLLSFRNFLTGLTNYRKRSIIEITPQWKEVFEMTKMVNDPVTGRRPATKEELATMESGELHEIPDIPDIPNIRFGGSRDDASDPGSEYFCTACGNLILEYDLPAFVKPGQRLYCSSCFHERHTESSVRMSAIVGGLGFCEVCGDETKVFWWAKCPRCRRVNRVLFKNPNQRPQFRCNAVRKIFDDDGDEIDRKTCGAELEWRGPNLQYPVACQKCRPLSMNPLEAPDVRIPAKPTRGRIIQLLSLHATRRVSEEAVLQLVEAAGGRTKVSSLHLPKRAERALAEIAA